jgi:hypothetical protein
VYLLCYSGLLASQRQVAMIAEMIHSASLIHDDVVDQADLRRGKPSVNVLWNHKKVGKAIFVPAPFPRSTFLFSIHVCDFVKSYKIAHLEHMFDLLV